MDYRFHYKIKLARDFESQGKQLHSINIYKSLIDEYPDEPEVYLSLAELYERIGSLDAAKSLFENIMNLDESENDFKIQFGKFLLRNGQFQTAVDIFKKISGEDEPISSFYIGYLNLLLEKFDEAKVYLLNFVISDEDPELIYEAYLYLAKTEFELKLYDNSLRYIKKAEVIFSDYWELYLLIAKIYYSLGMNNHAVNNIMKAVQLSPRETLVNYWAGKIFFANSELNKSIEYYTKFLKLNEKNNSDELFSRANNLIQLGRLKEALVTFQKAKILNSNIISAEAEIEKSKYQLNNKSI